MPQNSTQSSPYLGLTSITLVWLVFKTSAPFWLIWSSICPKYSIFIPATKPLFIIYSWSELHFSVLPPVRPSHASFKAHLSPPTPTLLSQLWPVTCLLSPATSMVCCVFFFLLLLLTLALNRTIRDLAFLLCSFPWECLVSSKSYLWQGLRIA